LLVSIILAVKNGEEYIEDSIYSILSQSYKNIELIIIDDGSSDNTKDIVYNIKDPRIKYFHQQNCGLAYSLNKAIEISKGNLIIRQDADDVSNPNRIMNLLNLYNDFGDDYVYTSDVLVVDLEGNSLFEKKITSSCLRGFQNYVNPFTHGSLAFPKKIFDEFKYDVNFKTSQDYDLLIRILNKYDFKSTNKIDYVLRLHPTSVTSKKWKTQIISKVKIYNKYKKLNKFNFSLFELVKLIGKSLIISIMFSASTHKSQYFYRISSIHFKESRLNLALLNSKISFKNSPFFLFNYYLFCKIKLNIWLKKEF
jgi:glycosyltransferase involved in cell wall biosynthesis